MNWDIGNWREQELLLERLKELGANVHFWDEREGKLDTSDEVTRKRVLDLILQHAAAPSQAGLDEGLQLASRYGMVYASKSFVLAGDVLAIDGRHSERAIDMYVRAIDAAPKPSIHGELGYALLRRAQSDELPLGHVDLAEMEPELTVTELDASPKIHERLTTFARGRKKELLTLAIDAYGRAYGYTLYWIGVNEPELYINPWVHLLVLDGLRVALLEIDRPDLVELTSIAYDAWTDAMGTDFHDWGEDVKLFERRFAQTRGFLQGRRVELTVQRAVEETRRKVVVSDPHDFASQVADTVAERLGPVPLATRARIEDDLGAQLRETWTRPPDSVREQITEGEWLRSLLEVHEGRDYTPVVLFYGKALESLLRYLSRSDDILGEFRRQLLDERIKVRWLSRMAPDEVRDHLVAAIDLRNPAAHGESGPYRPIPRSRMTKMRNLLIGSESEDGLFALLAKHAKWP